MTAQAGGYGFGTFKGVFTPSILTILGVVMYLRLGWVLGNVGLPATIVIVTLATSVTFLTALSLAALATNMRIGGGGAYFIISRSLGVEAGAAIGLPLFFAQALGISFYVVGFSESIVQIFPTLDPTVVGVVTLFALTALVYVSADLALKSQFVIMGAIAISLVSFFLGGPEAAAVGAAAVDTAGAVDTAIAATPVVPPPAPVQTFPFWVVFAVFFPAVTGIEAGIAMSGDLKKPARSLPLGTMLAVLVGFIIYLAIPVFLNGQGLDRQALIDDPLVMRKVARWGPLVLLGIWAASLSSAMGSLLGAPRTLQALAKDRVLPAALARGYGPYNDPRLATVISFAIGLTGILLGDLNAIAPILAMFFLTSYGVLNLSAGLEELVSNPAWRPQFRVPAWLPLTGFVTCLCIMLMIAPGATIMAVMTVGGIYYLMKRRSMRAQWGDMRLGFMMFFARVLLYRMEGMRLDERTWKPNLLVLSGSPAARWHLIELADAIAQSRSFVTVATFVPEDRWADERADEITETIRSYLRKRGVPAFIRTLPAADPFAGAATMIRSYGFGPIVPNTVLIGQTEKPSSFVGFAQLIQLITRSRRNLVIVRQHREASTEAAEIKRAKDRRIDVWWQEESPHASFLLALAILLRRSEHWFGATLRVKTIVDDPAEAEAVGARLKEYLGEARVEATPQVVIRGAGGIVETIRGSSADTDLVFLGIRPPGDDEAPEDYARYYEGVLRNTEDFPVTALVMAGEKMDFRRIFESAPGGPDRK